MLTILACSQTGMQARQMLERNPPTLTWILSSTTSFSALRRATSGLDSSSATTRSIGRPLMPPDLLMRSTAISTPTSAVLPPAAPAPESGCMVPSLYGLAWPKAARHGAGTNMVAPSSPPPHPTRRRRVTLPLYQNSHELSWSFQSLAIVRSSLWISYSQDWKHFPCLSRRRGVAQRLEIIVQPGAKRHLRFTLTRGGARSSERAGEPGIRSTG